MRKSEVPLQNSGLAISSSKEEWWGQLPQKTLIGRKSYFFKNQLIFVTAGSGFFLETDSEGNISRYPLSPGEILRSSSGNEIEIEVFSWISLALMSSEGALTGEKSVFLTKELLYSGMRRDIFQRYCRLSDVTTNLKNTLLFLIETGSCPKREGRFSISLPHFEIAEITGSTRETVSRSKKELEKRGFISPNGKTYSRLLITEETLHREKETNPMFQALQKTVSFARSELKLKKDSDNLLRKGGDGIMLCPVFNQPITQVAARNCMEEGKVFARRVRCVAVQCASPNRLCMACVDQGATASGKDLEGCFVNDPVSGLCEDHMKHGKKWRKENLLIVAKLSPVEDAHIPADISATKEEALPLPKESEEKKMGGKRLPQETIDTVLAWKATHPPEETRVAFTQRTGIKDSTITHVLKVHGSKTPPAPPQVPPPPPPPKPEIKKPAWLSIIAVPNAALQIIVMGEVLRAMTEEQMLALYTGNLTKDFPELAEQLAQSKAAYELLMTKLKS